VRGAGCEVKREYQVSSTSVYGWLDKYSVLHAKKVRQVIEPMSDSKKIQALRQKIAELEVTDVNQVWVSDMTYFNIESVFDYLTFIMDCSSRIIVGCHASQRLLTSDTTIPALRQAYRYLEPAEKPILHSDGGGRYYSRAFLALTHQRCINSMAESLYDNIHAERINGTIKNEYLKPWAPKD